MSPFVLQPLLPWTDLFLLPRLPSKPCMVTRVVRGGFAVTVRALCGGASLKKGTKLHAVTLAPP